MARPLDFFHLGGAVLMRMGNQIVTLDDATQVEILDDLKALQDAARREGARDLRRDAMARAFQLQHARLVSKLPADIQRSAA